MVRLSGEAARKPAQLSGGQRQRVALARALVGRPRVLLLDEPLGALDLKLREQMQIELKEIQREVGITFVIVTHDQDEALTLCDRLAVFNEGRIEQIGTRPRRLREPGQQVRRRLRRNLQRARRTRRRGPRRQAGHVRRPARTDRGLREGNRPGARGPHRRRHGLGGHLRRPHHQDRRDDSAGRHAHRHRPDGQHLAAVGPAARHPNHLGVAGKSPPPTVKSRSSHETNRRASRTRLWAHAQP